MAKSTPRRKRTRVEDSDLFGGWGVYKTRARTCLRTGWRQTDSRPLRVFSRRGDAQAWCTRHSKGRDAEPLTPIPTVILHPLVPGLTEAAQLLQDAGHPLGQTLADLAEHEGGIRGLELSVTHLGGL